MKFYCQENKYEFLVYDLKEKKIYIEDNSNQLIEYNLYQFQNEKK